MFQKKRNLNTSIHIFSCCVNQYATVLTKHSVQSNYIINTVVGTTIQHSSSYVVFNETQSYCIFLVQNYTYNKINMIYHVLEFFRNTYRFYHHRHEKFIDVSYDKVAHFIYGTPYYKITSFHITVFIQAYVKQRYVLAEFTFFELFIVIDVQNNNHQNAVFCINILI